MRSVADRYRDLFPAVILGSLLDEDTGFWHHAFVELLPDAPDDYTNAAGGARSGTVSTNYALEENNQRTAIGRNVWMRHRDEDGGQIHYAFHANFNPNHVTIPDGGSGPSGSGGCDFTVDGNACFEQDVTVGGDTTVNNLTINNYLTLTNWFNVSVVTGWCPVFTSTLKIDGVPRAVSPPVCVGGVVEWRTLRVPLGTQFSEPFCETDPDSCCEGGSGSGSGGPGPNNSCCSPMPPPKIYAHKADWHHPGPCDCLIDCVELDYDPARDAWYSTLPVGLTCPGTAPSSFFRVRCRAGLWEWAVITAGDSVLIEGVIKHAVCDPFFLSAWFFDNASNFLCADGHGPADPTFSYVIAEVPCPGGGSGACCSGQTPRTWAVPLAGLTGDCAAFNGTWTLMQDALDPCLWQGTAVSTNDLHFSIVAGQAVFSWDAGGGGGRTVYLADFGGDCCAALTLPLDTNNCDAAVPATVTLTPSCGTIRSACCPDDLLPATLTARFTGSLAGLGTVTLTYDAGTVSWSATLSGTPCGDVTISFICQFDGKWGLAILGGTQAGVTARLADDCSPFLWNSTGTSTGRCVGTFTVEVTG